MPKSALSRNGVTSPLGKFTAEIPKIKVPEETYELLRRAANDAGCGSVTEFVRELCMIRVHGEAYVASLYAERVAVVAGKGSE